MATSSATTTDRLGALRQFVSSRTLPPPPDSVLARLGDTIPADAATLPALQGYIATLPSSGGIASIPNIPSALAPPLDTVRQFVATPEMNDGLGLRRTFDMMQERVANSLRQGLPFMKGVGDAMDNIIQGARKGSFILPDPIRDPENPSTFMQIVGGFVGAGAEGFLAEATTIRALAGIAGGSGRAANVAKKSLEILGQTPQASLTRRFLGGAATGAASEVALRAGTGHWEDFGTGVTLAAVPGAALGAGAATIRGVRNLGVVQSGRDALPAALRSTVADRLVAPERASMRDNIGEMLDNARKGLRETFQYEAAMRPFGGFANDGLNLADEFRILKVQGSRAARAAEEDLVRIVEPLKALRGKQFAAAFQDFQDIVMLRDLQESASRGLETAGMQPLEIAQALQGIERGAHPAARMAAQRHLDVVNVVRDELISRGKIPQGGGFDAYFPHNHIIQTLADEGFRELSLPRKVIPKALRTTPKERARGGSARRLDADYLNVMHHALRRFYTNSALDDFTENVMRVHGVDRKALPQNVVDDLDSFGVAAHQGKRFATYNPDGAKFFRTNAIDDAGRAIIEQATATGKATGSPWVGINVDDIPAVRDVVAVGKAREVVLPAEIAERMARFHEPDPMYATKGPLRTFLRATSEWKRNTIYWGLSKFAVFQLLGDGLNTMRSFPSAFLRIRSGNLESSAWKSLRAIYAHYGTPMVSPEQLFNAGIGATGGWFGAGLVNDDPTYAERAAFALTGAGLGYVRGTRKRAGTLPPGQNPLLARYYTMGDEAGAINSGFVFSEEDLARRVLADKPGGLPALDRSALQRTRDTLLTFVTGKIHGDPLNVFGIRGFAETIEVIQKERENWLRLAAYINQLDDGIPSRIAAKRASEALVDYGRFSDFEDRILRRGILPFYSFYRHNIPNWFKAGIGRDVGGKGKVAFASLAGIGAFDLASQAWNNQFFPDVELSLDDYRRNQFHIILGNPATGEPLLSKRGEPLIIGFEMPYEQALELFGLARPGVVLSEFMGMPIHPNESLTGKALRLEELENLPSPARKAIEGVGDQIASLLNPFIKAPFELVSNNNWFTGSPIVPERYVGTKEQYDFMLRHLASQWFRQIRETQAVARRAERGEFNPVSSAFGLGLPIYETNPDRAIQVALHRKMQESAQATRSRRAPFYRQVDDLVYGRNDLELPEEGEMQTLQEIMNSVAPEDRGTIYRYYFERTAKSSIFRHWESLSAMERYRFVSDMEQGDLEAFLFYMSGGQDIVQSGAQVPTPGFMGR